MYTYLQCYIVCDANLNRKLHKTAVTYRLSLFWATGKCKGEVASTPRPIDPETYRPNGLSRSVRLLFRLDQHAFHQLLDDPIHIIDLIEGLAHSADIHCDRAGALRLVNKGGRQ